ncbi:MAG TPA: FAD-dependent oxidoreductase [Bacteroidales bacterium]|nr:FAD-dependent oxidoreductase [Bacteroidales bacterium]
MDPQNRQYDLLIVGGGVVGTALLYTICRYTDLKDVCLIEKYKDLGLVNSAAWNNSQTLHFGDIETNYTIQKATSVKQMADMVKNYLEDEKKRNPDKKIFHRYSKMVLGVGAFQSEGLRKRFLVFRDLFPDLQLIGKEEIARIEPKVVEGRPADQEIAALLTPDGYTVDFRELCHSFTDNAKALNNKAEVYFNTQLESIKRDGNSWSVKTNKGIISARIVIVAAGAHSLLIAKSLGYGKNLSLLSMAGSFYTAEKVLNGKVYTIQVEKLPFAAIHGDPEVHDETITRFGPTAKPIFRLERHSMKTVGEYWKTFGLGISPVISLLKIIFDRVLFGYVFLNFLYDLPIIGKRLFLKEVKKIIPTMKLSDLRVAKGYGGTRPQIVNNTTRKLEMGEAKLTGDNIVFNITPSPGASTCLGNAYNDTRLIMDFLGNRFSFDEAGFLQDLVK